MRPPLTAISWCGAYHTRNVDGEGFCDREAQRVIDLALRIHEGATEVRKPIFARELLEARELTPRQAIEWI
jgi:hypothetical protein